MTILTAGYFDGKTSRRQPVNLIIGGGKLKVVGRDLALIVDTRRVHRSLRVGNTPRWLYLPGGGACVTDENDAVDRITQTRRYERMLHLCESRPAFAVIAVALVAVAVWLLVDRGVPRAVDHIANHIPVETETTLGEQSLAGLSQHFLQPSKLPAARQKALREKFAAMVLATRDATPHRLEFRASPIVGPNAFALPSGIIVMTDELVRTSNNDLEVLGVLAHELGHVHHRHTMRRLLQSSATALIIAGITGDVASATSLAAVAPALLLQTKYSRDNEREADRYAIDMMRKANYNPGHLAAILHRMSAKDGKRAKGNMLPPFLSSHPPTEEREALARAGVDTATTDGEQHVTAEQNTNTTVALTPDKPRRPSNDPSQREVIALLANRQFDALEKLLVTHQQSFEAGRSTSDTLEKVFRSFEKVPRSEEAALNEWVKTYPASYVAMLARARFHYAQGMQARGTQFVRETPEENLRTMRYFLEKAQTDLERSLSMTPKPYLSRATLMEIAGVGGNRDDEKTQYREAVKLHPQDIRLRIAHMRYLEPRWGGSYREMEAFAAESHAQLNDVKGANRIAARVPVYRADQLKQAKDYAKALPLYNEAVALYPAPNTLCDRAVVYGMLNRDIEAMADLNQALPESKALDSTYCNDNAVWMARRATNADEAIAVLSQVIAIDASHANAFAQRGWRYQQQKKIELAFQDYHASAKLGDAWGELMTGKYLWSGWGVKQDRETALVWLRKAAEKGHPDAKLSLKQALEQVAKQ